MKSIRQTKAKKSLTSTERWRKNQDQHNQRRNEKYRTDAGHREQVKQKEREKYKVKKLAKKNQEKELLKKIVYDYFPLYDPREYTTKDNREVLCRGCKEKGIPRWKIQFCGEDCQKKRLITNAKWQSDGELFSEKLKKEFLLIAKLNLKLQEKKDVKPVKPKKVLAKKKSDKKGKSVGKEKSPPYNPPSYILIKRGIPFSNSIKKKKDVVFEVKNVGKENLPIVKPKPVDQGVKLFKQITEMFRLSGVFLKVVYDKSKINQWNIKQSKLFTPDEIDVLKKGKMINWKMSMEDGMPKWVRCKLVLGVWGGVKVKWEDKWYWLYIIDHDFLKLNVDPKLRQRLKTNILNGLKKEGYWYNETEHGIHHYVLSETQWPANVKLLWKDKFSQYFETGDVIQKGRRALFDKVFKINQGKMTIVKNFKEIQTLYQQPPFYAELITKEDIIKSKFKIKGFQKPQTIFEKKTEEAVLNDMINENNVNMSNLVECQTSLNEQLLMNKMLKYIQEHFKQENIYQVKTQPLQVYSKKTRRRFYMMRIKNLLTNQEQWVYLPIFGYGGYGVSGKRKNNIQRGNVVNLNLKQGNNLTFITNYTVC